MERVFLRRLGGETLRQVLLTIGFALLFQQAALDIWGGDNMDISAPAALETPKNEAFVKKYRELYGKVPSYYSESNYTTAQWIREVMKKTAGTWPGTEAFIKLFAGVKLDSVRGPVQLDAQLNPVHNIYIRKVERKKMFGYAEAELWNTVVKTYENVGQYWPYNKDEFLKQPVYSRTFPPCQHCE